ncbi:Sds3-like-domain-containing protein [Syncephalastrum racemosum]|uniref:Sds3-like-domain-containing protein n=1 Tax=Syncephalastrum racemosum TaxID=13706 RepID=A0A1X2HVY7_SYNRA|nr:Sds3-like-domain-containing protein [Syncephalastrum racemosum]
MEDAPSVHSSDGDDASTRPGSSRLSLGSSPSELSDDEDHPNIQEETFDAQSLTPTDKISLEDNADERPHDFDALFADSSDTLSNEPMDIDDRDLEASDDDDPFASVNDVPLSPEPANMDEDEEEEEEEEQEEESDEVKQENHEPTTEQVVEQVVVTSRRKRRGSSTLEQTEWQQRRNSRKIVATAPVQEETIHEEQEQEDHSEAIKEEERKHEEDGEAPTELDPPSAPGATVTTTTSSSTITTTVRETNQGSDEDRPEESQQWHKEALDALCKIEEEFARLREKMYQEKLGELNDEALLIAQGTHPELLNMMKSIEEKRAKRIQKAEAWRNVKRINFEQQFGGLEYQANMDFISRKNALRRSILSELNRKRWDLDNEREKLNDGPSDADRMPDVRTLSARKRYVAEETRELHRVKQILGFPTAPNADGLPVHLIQDDLVAYGLKPPETTTHEGLSSSSKHPVVSSYPSIYTFHGQLHYHGRIYSKGDHFTVVDTNAGRYSAKLLTATETEVQVQRTDGSKTKLPFAQLSKGKYQIFGKPA